MRQKAEVNNKYTEFEKLNYQKMKEYSKKQKLKIERLEAKIKNLDENLQHCEKMQKAQQKKEAEFGIPGDRIRKAI